MRIFEHLSELAALVGQDIATSEWIGITQQQIDLFAQATGDHQWIHVDPERAKDTPFGGTIAHGLYTLSLGPQLSYSLFEVEGVAFGLNYGYNKVRYPAPLPVGSKVRMRMELQSVEDIPGGAQITMKLTFEQDGAEKPVCVAEALSRVYTGG